MGILEKIESIKLFSEPEAWFIFRLAALAEAVGWTLLILAIAINRYKWPGYKIVIPIAGQVHGIFFIAYFGILLATYTSLGWSRKRFIIGMAAGIPPYGTFIFEQITSFIRRKELTSVRLFNLAYWRLVNIDSK